MSENESKPLGQAQTLRREVRVHMARHLEKNPFSFTSYMCTSAVMWLLGGREGVPAESRVRLVEGAHLYISNLHQKHPEDFELTLAHESIDNLVELTRARLIQETENVAKEGDLTVEAFEAWMEKEFGGDFGAKEEPGD